MNIDELIHYLQYDNTRLAIITKHSQIEVTPIFVFTPVDRLPDLGTIPPLLQDLEWYNEERPIYIVVQDDTAERIYTNCLSQWGVNGFVTIVNVNTKGTKSAIMNSLLHSTVDLPLCAFTELELPHGEWTTAECDNAIGRTKDDYTMAYSYSKSEDNSTKGVRLNYSLPSGIVYFCINLMRKRLSYRTVLPFYESGFYVQFLHWCAEHGMDFDVRCTPQKANKLCTHYDRIYAEDLYKLRRTTPNLFTRAGAIDVRYIHELATETRELIY